MGRWLMSAVVVVVLAGVTAGADEPRLPAALESCDDVEVVVTNFNAWQVSSVQLGPGGLWTRARIDERKAPARPGIQVAESQIGLFLSCWERSVGGANGRDMSYSMPGVINALFPPTEAVARALTDLSRRLLPGADDHEFEFTQVGFAVRLLGIVSRLAGGGPDTRLRALVSPVAPVVLEDLRQIWWECWDQWSAEDAGRAADLCRHYAQAANSWHFGGHPSAEELEAAEADLVGVLRRGGSRQRQIAILAAFDRDSMWQVTVRLARLGIEDRDPGVRLMVVRLADTARLDEDGEPYDAELRALLKRAQRTDPDRTIRAEAARMLALYPFGGVG